MKVRSVASVQSMDASRPEMTNFERMRLEQTRRLADEAHARKIQEEQRQLELEKKREAMSLVFEHRFTVDPLKYTRELSYRKHLPTHRYYCQVINASTEKVIREVPPVEQLDRVARWREFIRMLYGE